MKKTITLIICLILTSFLYCQTFVSTVNKINEKGKKEGLWINAKKKWFCYYNNGKFDGPMYSLNSNGGLEFFGLFKNGKFDGTWSFFDHKNFQCLSRITIIDANNKIEVIQKDINKKVICDVEAYEIDYFPDMKIKAEGKILFDNDLDSFERGEILNSGIWKYYDTNGNCIQTIDETGVWHHS